MLDLKGKFLGERIFMVGNGPSLAETPLHLMQDEYTFGFNRISKIYSSTTWRPSFFTCMTRQWRLIQNLAWRRAIQASVNLGIPSFLATQLSPYIRPRETRWLYPVVDRNPSTESWQWELEAGHIFASATIMYAAIQIAVYMGFNPIYLVGCDMGWKAWKGSDDPNHFDKEYSLNIRFGMEENYAEHATRKQQDAHGIIKQIGERHGFEVYNATIGGDLKGYKRVDLYSVLGL